MEKGIESEEDNLYKQTENVADNVLNSLNGINPSVGLYKTNNMSSIDYNRMFNLLYEAFSKALTGCKFTLDEDGFARIVKDELYKAV